jgi:crotonobetainyl-CoA:carnitine CoA-transferase CaiB-like acyl-CoA transferase
MLTTRSEPPPTAGLYSEAVLPQPLTMLSLEQATTLPFLTYRLACEGARVIRVEHPRQPDPNRFVGARVLPDEDGMQAYFLPNNCGKEAITLDLGTVEGRGLLHRLIQALPVDVFATNQRARSYAKLGLDPETLHALKPDLIWAGITGFGPSHDEAAYDPVLQARAGLMELTGEADGPPTVFGLPMVDLGAAEHGFGQVMKALWQRAVTGRGARIDVAMLQSAASWMVAPVALASTTGEHARRSGTRHAHFAPVSVYPTRDGYLYMAVGSDRQWAALVALVPFSGLAKPEYERNAGRIADVAGLHAALETIFRGLATEAALALLREGGIPVAKVQTVADLMADPLVAPSLLRVRDARSGLTVALPAPPGDAPPPLAFPPRLGEHTERILGEGLGLGAAEVAALRARGVI